MVFAKDRFFIVEENKKAKTANELYLLKDYVKIFILQAMKMEEDYIRFPQLQRANLPRNGEI